MPPLVWCFWGLALFVAIVYWLVVMTEGTYLGARPVAWLYDLAASRYDRIKAVQYVYELKYVGMPLLEAVDDSQEWKLLDVATGTGRVLSALNSAGYSNGRLYGIDRSFGMLNGAILRAKQYEHHTEYAQQDAMHLGFANDVFDCVSCLEALEFMQHPEQAIQEMLRVLKPGGILLLTNRVGFDSWFFPGRMSKRGRLETYLRAEGLGNIHSMRWQIDYDIVWARK